VRSAARAYTCDVVVCAHCLCLYVSRLSRALDGSNKQVNTLQEQVSAATDIHTYNIHCNDSSDIHLNDCCTSTRDWHVNTQQLAALLRRLLICTQ
jgi:hypothetical protein